MRNIFKKFGREGKNPGGVASTPPPLGVFGWRNTLGVCGLMLSFLLCSMHFIMKHNTNNINRRDINCIHRTTVCSLLHLYSHAHRDTCSHFVHHRPGHWYIHLLRVLSQIKQVCMHLMFENHSTAGRKMWWISCRSAKLNTWLRDISINLTLYCIMCSVTRGLVIYTAMCSAVTRLAECIDSVERWMRSNRLKLNSDKTQFMLLGSKLQLAKIKTECMQIGEHCIKFSTSANNLGVTFDPELRMDLHVNNITRSCFFQLRQLRSIRRSLTMEATKTLVHYQVAWTTATAFCMEPRTLSCEGCNPFSKRRPGWSHTQGNLTTSRLCSGISFIGFPFANAATHHLQNCNLRSEFTPWPWTDISQSILHPHFGNQGVSPPSFCVYSIHTTCSTFSISTSYIHPCPVLASSAMYYVLTYEWQCIIVIVLM